MSSQEAARAAGRVVVMFGKGPAAIPGFPNGRGGVSIRLAPTADLLAKALPGADGLLCWEAAPAAVAGALACADRLTWLQWPFIGVDGIVPVLRDRPEIVLTNARGVFEEPIAEYVLGLVLAMAKDLPGTLAMQAKRQWGFRKTETIAGKRALVVGVGGVGRAIGALLRSVGMEVTGVGRKARPGDSVFTQITPMAELPSRVSTFDYVIAAAPLTPETRGMFSATVFEHMRPTTRFINIGRGELVDEQAVLAALKGGKLAGAALDVFEQEPLPADSPLWSLDRVIISPHMAGDVIDTLERLANLFRDNLERFVEGRPLRNKVDPQLG